MSLPPRSAGDTVALVCTLLLTFVGIAGILVAICTLRILQHQTKAIQDQVDAVVKSERAWIDAKINKDKILGKSRYSISVKNHGKTPAQITGCSITCAPLPEGVDFSESVLERPMPIDVRVFVPSDETRTIQSDLEVDRFFSSTSEIRGAIYVTIDYIDVFTKEDRHTGIAYIYDFLAESLHRMPEFDKYE